MVSPTNIGDVSGIAQSVYTADGCGTDSTAFESWQGTGRSVH